MVDGGLSLPGVYQSNPEGPLYPNTEYLGFLYETRIYGFG